MSLKLSISLSAPVKLSITVSRVLLAPESPPTTASPLEKVLADGNLKVMEVVPPVTTVAVSVPAKVIVSPAVYVPEPPVNVAV